jgi:hypothetical protein
MRKIDEAHIDLDREELIVYLDCADETDEGRESYFDSGKGSERATLFSCP